MYRFHFSWFKTGLTMAGLTILLFLGTWQLHRADEKKHILDAFQHHLRNAPLALSSQNVNLQAYQRVVFQGKYAHKTLFLDNQYYHHQFGFDALHPVQLSDGRWVLVDRGWMRIANRHAVLPKLPVAQTVQTFSGYIYYPSHKSMSLGALLDRQQGTRFLIEKLDIRFIETLLHRRFMPFIIRLEKPEERAFVRDWPLTSMAPARHVGYAVQWFLMAFVLIVIYFAGSIHRVR